MGYECDQCGKKMKHPDVMITIKENDGEHYLFEQYSESEREFCSYACVREYFKDW